MAVMKRGKDDCGYRGDMGMDGNYEYRGAIKRTTVMNTGGDSCEYSDDDNCECRGR